ncbi:LysR family transcriptional regulator [uncultured Pseudoalteromonas sp.]|nr:LysR family transcriptional regulator [uncultured Pseudoalteromonas sp.]
MDIDALRTFCAFVDTGSFTRAAAQICRTQSAVSFTKPVLRVY